MAFGLPVHSAPHHVNRALSRACLVAAFGCLIATGLAPLAIQIARPELLLWPAAFAALPALLMLQLHSRWRSRATTIGYLLVGGAALCWYVAVIAAQIPEAHGGAAVFAVPTLALALNTGPTRKVVTSLWWCLLGLAVAYVALWAGLQLAGQRFAVHPAPLFALAIIVAVLVASVGLPRTRAMRTRLRRAIRNDRVAGLRVRLEGEAAAIMHDTVLGDLIAVSRSAPGPIDPALAAAIDRDLAHLLGEDWLLVNDRADAAGDAWLTTALYAAIVDVRTLGLEVTASGELGAISALEPERERALGLAVRQCLINVIRHSATMEAEVVVGVDRDTLSVMVVDGGAGFDVSRTQDDRLGLRNSVIRRVEEIGGRAHVWSTPGLGTSVLLQVPQGDASVGTR